MNSDLRGLLCAKLHPVQRSLAGLGGPPCTSIEVVQFGASEGSLHLVEFAARSITSDVDALTNIAVSSYIGVGGSVLVLEYLSHHEHITLRVSAILDCAILNMHVDLIDWIVKKYHEIKPCGVIRDILTLRPPSVEIFQWARDYQRGLPVDVACMCGNFAYTMCCNENTQGLTFMKTLGGIQNQSDLKLVCIFACRLGRRKVFIWALQNGFYNEERHRDYVPPEFIPLIQEYMA